ncbi:hypothetical protein CPT_Silvanus_029 [Stenotrophomonas phage Silvanus]|nr:hypothetical protein CPT_Silvanus_029 [Stenotrophomonas phage Silvanus]
MNKNKLDAAAETILELAHANWEFGAASLTPEGVDIMERGVRITQHVCHKFARHSGWWQEYDEMPEKYRKYFIGTKLALVHSEASEALEGVRKNLPDDHLPHRPMGEVEAADVIIRLLDLAGAMGWDVAGAMIEKLAYNQQRPDHKPEARQGDGGKTM